MPYFSFLLNFYKYTFRKISLREPILHTFNRLQIENIQDFIGPDFVGFHNIILDVSISFV